MHKIENVELSRAIWLPRSQLGYLNFLTQTLKLAKSVAL